MTSTVERSSTDLLERILSAVANDHRRVILRALNDAEGEKVTVSALVEAIVEDEQRAGLSDENRRRRVRTGLHHVHLPKLADCGLVVYDSETKQVRNATDDREQELLAMLESHHPFG